MKSAERIIMPIAIRRLNNTTTTLARVKHMYSLGFLQSRQLFGIRQTHDGFKNYLQS
jgi:hypothetical protein